MNYIFTDLSRTQVTNVFKSLTGDSFDVNTQPIPQYKENYFRLYIDDNENEFLELFFNPLGELVSFGYSVTHFDSRKNAEIRECGNHRVLHRVAPAVKNFMKYAVEYLEHDAPLHQNAQRLYNCLSKNI